jgi:PiT family inorganic phosphate transporter
MPDASLGLLILIITLAVGFGVVNGLNDAANAIAAVVGTRVLSPRRAIILASIAELLGAATGTAVALTIGKGILIPEAISNETLVAALAAVIIWGTVATYYGLPVSLTHSFVAAFAAAGLAAVGSGAINWSVMSKVLASVVTAPVLGFIGGFALMVALLWVFRKSVPARVRVLFSRLQVLSSFFIAYSHGKNDGQMPIGIIVIALVAYTGDQLLWDNIPIWVILLSAGAISFGTATGGWRVMKTLGMKVTTLRPIHGFAAQTAGAAVIEGASLLGIPVSTTHCISTSIMGVGATRRLSAVRWGVAGNIVTAWIITFPICGALGYILASLFGLMS